VGSLVVGFGVGYLISLWLKKITRDSILTILIVFIAPFFIGLFCSYFKYPTSRGVTVTFLALFLNGYAKGQF